MPREYRKDPEFRQAVETARQQGHYITASTPLQIGNQTNDMFQNLLGQFRLPSPPKFYQTPQGTLKKVSGGWVFEETPELRAKREQREALITQFMTQLGQGISAERVAQISELSEKYGDKMFKESERMLRQIHHGKGTLGSGMADSMINASLESAERAMFFAEEMFARDMEATRQALQLLETTGDAQAARALQATQMGVTDATNMEQLRQQAHQQMTSMLGNYDLGQQQLAMQRQQLASQKKPSGSSFDSWAPVVGGIIGSAFGQGGGGGGGGLGSMIGGLFGQKTPQPQTVQGMYAPDISMPDVSLNYSQLTSGPYKFLGQ